MRKPFSYENKSLGPSTDTKQGLELPGRGGGNRPKFDDRRRRKGKKGKVARKAGPRGRGQ